MVIGECIFALNSWFAIVYNIGKRIPLPVRGLKSRWIWPTLLKTSKLIDTEY